MGAWLIKYVGAGERGGAGATDHPARSTTYTWRA